MKLAAVYSFNQGKEVVAERYPDLLVQVNDVIRAVDASQCKIKKSKEKTMAGQLLYSPIAINKLVGKINLVF